MRVRYERGTPYSPEPFPQPLSRRERGFQGSIAHEKSRGVSAPARASMHAIHCTAYTAYTAYITTASLQSLLPRFPHARTCTRYCVPGTSPSSVTRAFELVSVTVNAVGAAAVA